MKSILMATVAVTLVAACATTMQSALKLMDATAFETTSAEHTLYFENSSGEFIGAEQYLPNRQTIWKRADGQCLAGSWEAEGEHLCFSYSSGRFCYRVEGDDEGAKRFDYVGDNQRSSTLFVSKRDREPADC